jgi:hypothetical protein
MTATAAKTRKNQELSGGTRETTVTITVILDVTVSFKMRLSPETLY